MSNFENLLKKKSGKEAGRPNFHKLFFILIQESQVSNWPVDNARYHQCPSISLHEMIEKQTLQIFKLLKISLPIRTSSCQKFLIVKSWWAWLTSLLPSHHLRMHNLTWILIFRQSSNFQEGYSGFTFKISQFQKIPWSTKFCSRIMFRYCEKATICENNIPTLFEIIY